MRCETGTPQQEMCAVRALRQKNKKTGTSFIK